MKRAEVWSEGQEEAKTTKEDASGGEQECWFGEGGCLNWASWRVGVGEIAVRDA